MMINVNKKDLAFDEFLTQKSIVLNKAQAYPIEYFPKYLAVVIQKHYTTRCPWARHTGSWLSIKESERQLVLMRIAGLCSLYRECRYSTQLDETAMAKELAYVVKELDKHTLWIVQCDNEHLVGQWLDIVSPLHSTYFHIPMVKTEVNLNPARFMILSSIVMGCLSLLLEVKGLTIDTATAEEVSDLLDSSWAADITEYAELHYQEVYLAISACNHFRR